MWETHVDLRPELVLSLAVGDEEAVMKKRLLRVSLDAANIQASARM